MKFVHEFDSFTMTVLTEPRGKADAAARTEGCRAWREMQQEIEKALRAETPLSKEHQRRQTELAGAQAKLEGLSLSLPSLVAERDAAIERCDAGTAARMEAEVRVTPSIIESMRRRVEDLQYAVNESGRAVEGERAITAEKLRDKKRNELLAKLVPLRKTLASVGKQIAECLAVQFAHDCIGDDLEPSDLGPPAASMLTAQQEYDAEMAAKSEREARECENREANRRALADAHPRTLTDKDRADMALEREISEPGFFQRWMTGHAPVAR